MGIYQFNEDDAFRFASHVGVKSRKRGDQLEFTYCPYCKNTKDKYTFGISLKTGQFECKRSGCGMKGNMITLAKDFGFSINKEVDTYYRNIDYTSKQWRSFKKNHEIMTRDRAIEYMENRGIHEDIVRKYELTTKTDNDSVLVFPFIAEDGETITFIKYRNMDFIKGQTNGSKEWCEKDCKPILFGMNHATYFEEPLIITEGQIDSLSLASAGIHNAVSVPTGCNGFTWVPYCYDFVSKFNKIIVMGDYENGRITLADDISRRWPNKTYIVRKDDYRGCKDANEILQKYGASALVDAVNNAEPSVKGYIIELSKVRNVDIMKIETIKTEMAELDKILSGGFRIGQLAVLTGKRGEGKSTIASMWMVRALDQGYNCFAYSGELPDFFFKNWVNCQISGKNELTNSESDMLDAWYAGKMFLFDQNSVEDDELVDIVDICANAITQHGCKFLIIDNLMTALSVDTNLDLYREQSAFVGRLATLAKKYGVFILLIVHPRKGNIQDSDDISGSSNITDRADIVLSYGQRKDGTDDERELRVLKNRLTGNKGTVNLVYDSYGHSRRIASNTAEFRDINFDWNTEFVEPSEEEIPF